jgi:hypothetical protein
MSIQKLLDKALSTPKTHKPKRAVKSLVSRNFYTDGNLFIERFDQALTSEYIEHRNFRAKTIVDLAMSIECSLKSLIFSLSKDNETPKVAYKIAINKGGHNLTKLYDEVKKRAKHRFKLPKKNNEVFDKLTKLKVVSRYSFEIWSLRFHPSTGAFFLGNDLITKTVDNSVWAAKVRNEAVILNNLAAKCHSKFLQKHAILSGKKFAAYEEELAKFLSN